MKKVFMITMAFLLINIMIIVNAAVTVLPDPSSLNISEAEWITVYDSYHEGRDGNPNMSGEEQIYSASTADVIDRAIEWAIATANDQSHGYSQTYRWGNPDYDCSSFVISAYRAAGLSLSSASYTGDMKDAFESEGFQCFTADELGANSSSSRLVRGDILLKPGSHTEMYIGNNQLVGAHSAKASSSHPNRSSAGGDQGDEISVTGYYSHPWTYVLRYPTSGPDKPYTILDYGDNFCAWILSYHKGNSWIHIQNNNNYAIVSEQGHDDNDLRNRWHFVKQSDGSYIIESVYDGKCLTIPDANAGDACIVTTTDYYGGAGQKWLIVQKDGYTAIKSSYCEKVINCSSDAGASVNIWDISNGWESQTFSVYKIDSAPLYSVDNSYGDDFYAWILSYHKGNSWIHIQNNNNYAVVSEQGHDDNDRRNQWHFMKLSDGSYKISNADDGKCLTIPDSGINDDDFVTTADYTGGAGQKWFIVNIDGFTAIRSSYCEKVINCPADAGANVNIWDISKRWDSQTFSIYRMDFSPEDIGREMTSGMDRVLPDGDYLIAAARADDKSAYYYLDIEGMALPAEGGTNISLCGPVANPRVYEMWTLTYEDGFYTIKQKGTNMSLDVTNASVFSGANIQVCNNNGSSAQKWVITQNGTDGYRIQSKCSGFSVDIDGGKIENGKNIRQWKNNDTMAQSWIFIPYQPEQTLEDGRYVVAD